MAVAVTSILASCTETATSPVAQTGDHFFSSPAAATMCAVKCAITQDDWPFAMAAAPSDTVGASLFLARVRVAGSANAAITLALPDGGDVSGDASDAKELIMATVDGVAARAFSVAALAHGVDVYRFGGSDTVTIEYRILRGRAATRESVRLVQSLRGDASVIDATRPWIRATRPTRLLAEGTSCTVGEPGSLCGDAESTAQFSSWYAAATPDGRYIGWSSTPCCGQSVAVTIQFSVPVSSVTVTAADPDFAGNTVTAFDLVGNQVDAQAFAYDNAPGYLTYDTRTVSGGEHLFDSARRAHRRLRLVPAAASDRRRRSAAQADLLAGHGAGADCELYGQGNGHDAERGHDWLELHEY